MGAESTNGQKRLRLPQPNTTGLLFLLQCVCCCELALEMGSLAAHGVGLDQTTTATTTTTTTTQTTTMLATKQKQTMWPRRWVVILCIELVKAMIRLLLTKVTERDIVPQSDLPTRSVLIARNSQEQKQQVYERETLLTWKGRAPVRKQTVTKRAIGELIWIVRPVVYAASLMTWGRRSWKPWLLSITTDLVSCQLSTTDQERVPLTTTEKTELSRRRMLLLFYLLRWPLFDRVQSVVGSITPSLCSQSRVVREIGKFVDAYRTYYAYIGST